MSNFDLTTQEGRDDAINLINVSCGADFVLLLGDDFAPNALCKVWRSSIEVFLIDTENIDPMKRGKRIFGSNLDINRNSPLLDDGNFIYELSISGSGSFTPKDSAQYWKTIHAAAILKKWDEVCKIAERHILEHRELVKEIQIANNLNPAQ